MGRKFIGSGVDKTLQLAGVREGDKASQFFC